MLKLIFGTTNPNINIDLEDIAINPNTSATIKYALLNNATGYNEKRVLVIDGEQYKQWGTDDDFVFHIICARERLKYIPYKEPEFIKEVFMRRDDKGNYIEEIQNILNPKYNINYVTPVTIETDHISVHNDGDIIKIASLQEQVDAQAKKLKTITDMLVGKGMI